MATRTDFQQDIFKEFDRTNKKNKQITPQEQCRLDGGIWDDVTQTCIPKYQKPQEVKGGSGGVQQPISSEQRERISKANPNLVVDEFGNVMTKEQQKTAMASIGGMGAKEAQEIRLKEEEMLRQQMIQNEMLAGQVGRFEQRAIEPTGLDVGEAVTTGLVGAIPRALGYAAAGAGYGALGGAVAGAGVGAPVTATGGAAIGATVGFVTGISSSIISNMKQQRRDSTTAQKRVLDEGKQTLKDWATLAEADPANKAFYLSQYNLVLSDIDEAYRQMKLDTSRDLAKFETALPDLAEFEAFYSAGGERDALEVEMRQALLTPVMPEYKMTELALRRL